MSERFLHRGLRRLGALGVAAALLAAPVAAEASRLKVMVFNIEYGGRMVSFDKIAEAVIAADPDVVFLSEAQDSTGPLAQKLAAMSAAWANYDFHSGMHIISKYPLSEDARSQGAYLYLEPVRGKYVLLANTHLWSEKYGPYLMKEQLHPPGGKPPNIDKAAIIAIERRNRLAGLTTHLDLPAAKPGVPIFLGGDFNTPSHRDYTAAAVAARTVADGKADVFELEWPVSKALEDKGFRDSYRERWSDPGAKAGYTYKAPRRGILGDPGPKPEQPDRIDFLYVAGPIEIVRTIDSVVIGEDRVPQWPSDHRALMSTFELDPAKLPDLPWPRFRGDIAPPPAASELDLRFEPAGKAEYFEGDDITVGWANGPARRWDSIAIYAGNVASSPPDQAPAQRPEDFFVALSINGPAAGTLPAKPNGTVTFSRATTADLDDAEKIWPLKAGPHTACYVFEDVKPFRKKCLTFMVKKR